MSIPAVLTLWQREMVRFYRQPSRVAGALGTPFVFWLLIGSGIGSLKYFFPGTLLLIVLFTSIFSTISLIEDRREGFLQGVLIAPVSRSVIVLGKVLGGAAVAVTQGVLFLFLAPFVGFSVGPAEAAGAVAALFLNAFTLTSLGVVLAWQFQSIQGFHAVMNLFLIPLWLLSGALFPAEQAAGWMQVIMKMNPLTYGLALLERPLGLDAGGTLTPVLLTAAFGLALFLAAVLRASRRSVRDLV